MIFPSRIATAVAAGLRESIVYIYPFVMTKVADISPPSITILFEVPTSKMGWDPLLLIGYNAESPRERLDTAKTGPMQTAHYPTCYASPRFTGGITNIMKDSP
jgi:hypothetical protein